MITGDNPLTACHVAKELRFTSRGSMLILTPSSSSNAWQWESIDQTQKISLEDSIKEKSFKNSYDLCVTGEVRFCFFCFVPVYFQPHAFKISKCILFIVFIQQF